VLLFLQKKKHQKDEKEGIKEKKENTAKERGVSSDYKCFYL
jgi:hypothetical protein